MTDGGRYSVVGSHFARDLERELAAAEESIRMRENSNAELTTRINALTKALDEIAAILQQPAANYRVMQIAEPARRVLNIIKQTKAAQL